jgi:hypothetical protein
MKKLFFQILLTFSIIFFVTIQSLIAEDEEEGLYFTYAGPVIGAGFNKLTYRDWSYDSNTRESKKLSGYFLSSGAMLNIYVGNFIGEFSLQYMGDFCSEERVNVQHMFYTSSGKYSYTLKQINSNLSIASGLGVYLESSPSSINYNGGGGINFLLGGGYILSREIRIVSDIVVRYGYFGIGDDSNKFSIGVKIGAIYKVGRI